MSPSSIPHEEGARQGLNRWSFFGEINKSRSNGGDDGPTIFNATKTTKTRKTVEPFSPTTTGATFLTLSLRSFLGVTVALYILNQKHCLPLPISRVVSRYLFWPTLPITVGRRLGVWTTPIDDTVVMGGAPFGFARLPEKLKEEYNIQGVINLCEEYPGPVQKYQALGMTQLYLPTPDHFEPSLSDLEQAVQFIQSYKKRQDGSRVYVHCRAGHGRSAAIVLAWLLSKDPHKANLQGLNQELGQLRNVRKTLFKQDNIRRYHEKLKSDMSSDASQSADVNTGSKETSCSTGTKQ